jgi:plasmid maintenance system killer protein
MKIAFSSNMLERCATDEREAIREWGPLIGRWYVQRVAVVAGVRTSHELFQVKALRLHPLKGKLAGQYALTIKDRWRLIILPLSQTEVLIREVSKHYE